MIFAKQSLRQVLDASSGRPSGFDYMRVLLAIAVVAQHSLSTSYGPDVGHDISPLRGLARFILPMFFALSGFLVAGSMERCRTLIKFLGLRAVRIYPALAVEVLLSALLIGPMITSVPLKQYFTDPQFFRYILNVTGHISYYLPGVFETTPVPRKVNAQLWTVPFELYCYICLAFLIFIGAKRHRIILPIGMIVVLGLSIAQVLYKRGHITEYWTALPGPMLIITFLGGVCLYSYRDIIPYSGRLCIILAAISFVCLRSIPHGSYIAIFMLPYVTVYLGLRNPRRISLIKGADYSYGIYLYGFVVQQFVMDQFPAAREWYWNLLICIPLSALVAALSWHLVEKPAQGLKTVVDAAERWWERNGARLRGASGRTRGPLPNPDALTNVRPLPLGETSHELPEPR